MENKKLLLLNLCDKISKIDCQQPNNKIVKDLDKITQEYFIDLYNLLEIEAKKQLTEQKKNGHCC